MGFPLVKVEAAEWREGSGWVLTLSQIWFILLTDMDAQRRLGARTHMTPAYTHIEFANPSHLCAQTRLGARNTDDVELDAADGLPSCEGGCRGVEGRHGLGPDSVADLVLGRWLEGYVLCSNATFLLCWSCSWAWLSCVF